ncbi:MAG: NADH oxidase, partial [Ignavibacteriales bacterium]
MEKFESLLAPGQIGGLKIANRVFMPPMGTGLSNYQGEVTPEILAYYGLRAKNRPGVVVVEISCVDAPRGKASLQQLRIDHPRYISGMSRLSETIKASGSRAFIQLHHAGRQTSLLVTEGEEPLAPSAIPCRLMQTMPKAAAIEDIHGVQGKFVMAAAMAQAAGFDGVELHAAHGYLLSQFISPYSNNRDDEYGGSTEGRSRIVMEIIQQIKKICPGLVVGVRVSVTDFIAGGLEPDEGVEIAALLESAGADYISVSNGQ